MKCKVVVAIFQVIEYAGTQRYYIIAWETDRPWNTYEVVLYYLPRKKLSEHYILSCPVGVGRSYNLKNPDFEKILGNRTNAKKVKKIKEYEI